MTLAKKTRKQQILEALATMLQESLFTQISVIINNEARPFDRCEKILFLLLAFCERNPGITRLLTGDALTGETERLRDRISQLYNRLETELRKVLRDSELHENIRYSLSVNMTVNIMLSVAEGRISQFVRSDFSSVPTENWQQVWPYVVAGLMQE